MSKGRDFRGPRKRGFDDDFAFDNDFRRRTPRGGPGGGFPEFAAPPPMMTEGPIVDATVKWFNAEKGFGFAELADGTGDAFLHIRAVEAAGHQSLPPGAKLKVNVGQGAKGRQVTRVIEVDVSTAQAEGPRGGGGGGFGGPRGGGGGFGGPRPPRAARPQIDPSTAVEVAGSVKWFNGNKGFGFVAAEDGGKDVFVHISVLERAGLNDLAEGQRVKLRVVDTPKGREAVGISLG
jgi:cold shock protein